MANKKAKKEAHLLKEAIRMGMEYAERQGVAEFEPTDSAELKIEYIYRLLVHDELIQPLAKLDVDLPNMKHKLAKWAEKQLPESGRKQA